MPSASPDTEVLGGRRVPAGVIDVEGEAVGELPLSSDTDAKVPAPSDAAANRPAQTRRGDPSSVTHATRSVREHRRRNPSPTQAGFLVSQLCDSPSGARSLSATIAELMLLHDEGLEELTARFPGPLWSDPRIPGKPLPHAGELGPIPAALLAFGRHAIPAVVALLDSNDPEDRLCAAAIARDFPSDEVLSALVALVLHSDANARRMALRVLPSLSRLPRYARELGRLQQMIDSVDAPSVWRVRAVEALAQLGDRSIVPRLIPLLRDEDRGLAGAAHQGLCLLTAQDWGRSRRLWTRWLARHGHRPRHEWLLLGLAARRLRLRLHALDGLSLLLGVPVSAGPRCSRADCLRLAHTLGPELGARPSTFPRRA